MKAVNIKEARKRLKELVDAAEKGERVVITRRGKKVAELGPPAQQASRRPPSLAEFRAELGRTRRLSTAVIELRRKERY